MRVPQSWRTARVTLALVVVTTAMWVIPAVLGLEQWAFINGAFIPASVAEPAYRGLTPFWLTPLTATLLHGGLLHLAFNLLILAYCGRPVESVLGPGGLGALYVVGAYAAAAAQYAMDPASPVPMVGASGAISAVIGAYAILFGRNKVRIANPRLAMWLNALWLLGVWVGLQVALALTVSFALDDIQVAVAAHVGGFLAGLLLANPLLLFRYRRA